MRSKRNKDQLSLRVRKMKRDFNRDHRRRF